MKNLVRRLPALAAALAFTSCGLPGIKTRVVDPAEMPCSGVDLATGAWESAPFPVSVEDEDMGDAGTSGECTWLRWEKRQQIIIPHDLGRTPVNVLVYLAFRPSGVGGSLASGDPARIMAVDADEVILENRMDEAFYLRLVVE